MKALGVSPTLATNNTLNASHGSAPGEFLFGLSKCEPRVIWFSGKEKFQIARAKPKT
jgi:hypothetical protein